MTSVLGIGPFIPQSDKEQSDWARIQAFVAQHEAAAFSRDPLIGGHITGSALVLSGDGSHVLLTHHRKLDRWLQLGGHCDGIVDARFVALKEAYEESGLSRISYVEDGVFDVDIHEIPANLREPAHLHYDIRFLLRAQMGNLIVSHESKALAWVPLTRIAEYQPDASLRRMCDKVMGRDSV